MRSTSSGWRSRDFKRLGDLDQDVLAKLLREAVELTPRS